MSNLVVIAFDSFWYALKLTLFFKLLITPNLNMMRKKYSEECQKHKKKFLKWCKVLQCQKLSYNNRTKISDNQCP